MLTNFFYFTIKKLLNATLFSLKGLKTAWRKHWAFRFELILCLFAVPLALWLGRTAVEKVLLLGSVLLIMIVELLNSAIETSIDRISQERHPLSGEAKDLGSAAVFLACLNAGITWIIVIFVR